MFDQLQPVTISSRAAEEIRKIMQTKNIPSGYGLRIGVKGGGGCGGVSLILGFDKIKETDLSYFFHDIPVYIDKKHTLYVIGKEVDFVESDQARGFTFIDPNQEIEN